MRRMVGRFQRDSITSPERGQVLQEQCKSLLRNFLPPLKAAERS
jgi:hypothetical protein